MDNDFDDLFDFKRVDSLIFDKLTSETEQSSKNFIFEEICEGKTKLI